METKVCYQEIGNDRLIYPFALEFSVGDFERARSDPTFVLRGKKVPNMVWVKAEYKEWLVEREIARIGQCLGFSSTFDQKTLTWSVRKSKPKPIPKPKASKRKMDEASGSGSSSQPEVASSEPNQAAANEVTTSSSRPTAPEQQPFVRKYIDMSEQVERLAFQISQLQRNPSNGMFKRSQLKNVKFSPHFDRKTGTLLRTSPMYLWYDDPRLFTQDEWSHLLINLGRGK